MNGTTEYPAPKIGPMILVTINSILAVPTAVANALVIVVILTTSSLKTLSYLLLTNLAFSDLAVGLICQPGFAVLVFMKLSEHKTNLYLFETVFGISTLVSFVSVLTITAISVDRYLAIRLKMQYRSVVTVRRIRRFRVCSWIGTLVLMFVAVLLDGHIAGVGFGVAGATVLLVCLLVIVVCYTLSYRTLKIHCAQIQPQGNEQPNSTPQSNAIDVLKYRRLLNSISLIMALTLICYLPLLGVYAFFVRPVFNHYYEIWGLMSIMYLNSSMNPVIYITRMKDIRQACVQMLRKLFKCKD